MVNNSVFNEKVAVSSDQMEAATVPTSNQRDFLLFPSFRLLQRPISMLYISYLTNESYKVTVH